MYSNFKSGLADPISWSAEASGFNRLTIEGLKADVGTTLTQDLSLVVGTIAEAIDVNGKTSLVETANGAIGTTVQVSRMLEMPLVERNVFGENLFCSGHNQK